MEKITVYCDGGCRGNQRRNNVGGWGYRLEYKGISKEEFGGTRNTTNNKMEIQACIEALNAITDRTIHTEVVTDSNYLVQGMNKWIKGWKKNGWMTSKGTPVKNKELWVELNGISEEFLNITFTHCYGHADNEGNIRADFLANKGMDEQMHQGQAEGRS